MLVALGTSSAWAVDEGPRAVDENGILHAFPNLQKFLYAERKTNLYFGFGVSPMTIQNNRIGFSGNLFQIHYISDPWDLEIFSASFGTTLAQQDYAKTRYFVLRTAPKFKLFRGVSVGPVGGAEFVSFPNLISRLQSPNTDPSKRNYFTPEEPYSSWGLIYGVNLAETFPLGNNHLLKINEIVYRQTYPFETTSDGWTYFYKNPQDSSTDPDRNLIKTGTVFLLEISFLL